MPGSSILQIPVLEAGNRPGDSGRSNQALESFCSAKAVPSGLCSKALDLVLLCNYCKDKFGVP